MIIMIEYCFAIIMLIRKLQNPNLIFNLIFLLKQP